MRRGVTQAASLGYWLGLPYVGRGYMTEAVRAAVRFAFETLHLHRLEAATMPNNAASIRVLERNGFRREGSRAPLSEDQRRVAGPRSARAAQRRCSAAIRRGGALSMSTTAARYGQRAVRAGAPPRISCLPSSCVLIALPGRALRA